MYELDALGSDMGHLVIHLPPYHCHYNAVELLYELDIHDNEMVTESNK